MYTAIIVKNYIALKQKKLLISQAMANLIYQETRVTLHKWANLICFRKPAFIKKHPDEGKDSDEENRNAHVEKIDSGYELLKYNWHAIANSKVETKTRFVARLKVECKKAYSVQLKRKSMGLNDYFHESSDLQPSKDPYSSEARELSDEEKKKKIAT